MSTNGPERSALASAIEWGARVTTISVSMVLPALIGYWIDQRAGTGLVFAGLGLALGLASAFWQLWKLVKRVEQGDTGAANNDSSDR